MSAGRMLLTIGCLVLCCTGAALGEETTRNARIKDLVTVEGVRDNALLGYGLVVGLNGTGDRRQTVFSTQTLTNILQRMGVQVPPAAVRVNNIAAVFVTSNLPAFARPGMQIDVTVSSAGDAKSLEGGLLLLTSLYAADGQAYAAAQGPLTLGGFAASAGANSRQVNHPTVARIPNGAIVERAVTVELQRLPRLSLLLRDPDFATARDVAAAINHAVGKKLATAIDSRRIEIDSANASQPAPDLLATVGDLNVEIHPRAKVVVNERTGTVVMGKNVKLGAVSILHGNLEIEISTRFEVVQPGPLSNGTTAVVPQTSLRAQESPVRRVELKEGASVEELVRGLQAIGATARDVVAILQSMKAAGALQAELEIL